MRILQSPPGRLGTTYILLFATGFPWLILDIPSTTASHPLLVITLRHVD